MPRADVFDNEFLQKPINFFDSESEGYKNAEKAGRYLAVRVMNSLFDLYDKQSGEKLAESTKREFRRAVLEKSSDISKQLIGWYARNNRLLEPNVNDFLNYFEDNKGLQLYNEHDHKAISKMYEIVAEKAGNSLDQDKLAFVPFMDKYCREHYFLGIENNVFEQAGVESNASLTEEAIHDIGGNPELQETQSMADVSVYNAPLKLGNPAAGFFKLFDKNYDALTKNYQTREAMFGDLKKRYVKAKKELNEKLKNKTPLSENESAFREIDDLLSKDSCFLKAYKAGDQKEAWNLFASMKQAVVLQNAEADRRKIAEDYKKDIGTAVFEEASNKNPYARLVEKGGAIQHSIKLLESGDEFLRGSSKAYKEIQKNLRELEKFVNDLGDGLAKNLDAKVYVATAMEAIADKAQRYIEKHKTVEQKFSKESYEGKRVALMRKVFNRLTERSKCIRESDYFTEQELQTPVSSATYKTLSNKFGEMGFTASSYAAMKAIKANEGKKTLKVTLFTTKENLRNSESLKAMNKALCGQKLSLDKLDKMHTTVAKNFDAVKVAAEGKNELTLKQLGIECINQKARMDAEKANLSFLDNLIFEEEKAPAPAIKKVANPKLTFTGDHRIDEVMCGRIKKIATDELVELNKKQEEVQADVKNEKQNELSDEVVMQ